MAEKKITRKVITKKIADPDPDLIGTNSIGAEVVEQTESDSEKVIKTKKACQFCQSQSTPNYTDMVVLRRFTTDRAKIVPKAKSNLCSKHQRAVTKNIKYARHLSLLPFTPLV